jgi:DNA-binding MarR family transcriptional regulator
MDLSLEVSGPKLSALSVLAFGGPCTIQALADAEHVRQPTMSRLVEELQRDGLVVRRPKLDDRRAVLLEATPKGARILEQGRMQRIVHLAARLEHLTPEELETLGRAVALLERLLLEEH